MRVPNDHVCLYLAGSRLCKQGVNPRVFLHRLRSDISPLLEVSARAAAGGRYDVAPLLGDGGVVGDQGQRQERGARVRSRGRAGRKGTP